MPYLQLTPTDKQRINATLASAFTSQQLYRLVTDAVPSLAGELPEPGYVSRDDMVFRVREEAERQWLVDRLLVAAAAARPTRPDLLALVLNLSQRPGWAAAVETHALNVGSALEKVTSGPADPFFDATLLSRWMVPVLRQVCQVRCGPDRGTGFLVAPDLVLTCFHVVEGHLTGAVPAREVQVRFDYRRTPAGEDPPDDPTAWIGLRSGWTIPCAPASDADLTLVGEPAADALDFALLRLAAAAGQENPPGEDRPRGWIDMSHDRALPEAGSAMFIVQHPVSDGPQPRQLPLQITLATPGYEGANQQGTRIAYTPSTRKGSSGSPVFDRTLTAVALHHNRGVEKTNRGIPLAKIRAALAPDIRDLLVAPPA
jgi:hypothetical protein